MASVMARGLLGPFPVAVHFESCMFTVKCVRFKQGKFGSSHSNNRRLNYGTGNQAHGAKADDMAKQNSSGVAFRALPVSRSCVRCEGLLVSEWTYDLQDPGTHNVESLRCVQCGNRTDPVVLQNQLRLSDALQSERQVWHTNPLRKVA